VFICRDVSKIRENSKLAADNKMLQVYNSSVSHELLTPLRCIVEISSKLVKQKKLINADAEFKMQVVVNSAQMLLNQVSGNLDKNLLDKDMFKPMFEAHKLYDVIKSTIDMLTLQADERRIKIKYSGMNNGSDNSMQVMIDKTRVQQILVNLIQNSIKFSTAGDFIDVSID